MFQALGAAIPGFFTALITAGEEAAKAVGQQFIDLGTVISDALHGDFAGAKAAFGDMGADAAARARRLKGAFKGCSAFRPPRRTRKRRPTSSPRSSPTATSKSSITRRQRNRNTTAFGALGAKKKTAPPTQQVPNLPSTRRGKKTTRPSTPRKRPQPRSSYGRTPQHSRKSILDGELKRRQVTTAQWLAGTKDALADELQDTIATYQAELANRQSHGAAAQGDQ